MPELPEIPAAVPEEVQLPADPVERKLTVRQERFIEEYLVDSNGTHAAIRAGYSPNGASVTATHLLAHSSIADRIARFKADRARRLSTTADQILNEYKLLAEASVDWFTIDELGNVTPNERAPEGAMRAIKSIEKDDYYDREGNLCIRTKITLWDKVGALKVMGRHAGFAAVNDKVEVVGKGGGPLEMLLTAAPVDALKAELDKLAEDASRLEE